MAEQHNFTRRTLARALFAPAAVQALPAWQSQPGSGAAGAAEREVRERMQRSRKDVEAVHLDDRTGPAFFFKP